MRGEAGEYYSKTPTNCRRVFQSVKGNWSEEKWVLQARWIFRNINTEGDWKSLHREGRTMGGRDRRRKDEESIVPNTMTSSQGTYIDVPADVQHVPCFGFSGGRKKAKQKRVL